MLRALIFSEGRSGLGRDAAEKRLRERKMQIMVKRAAQLVSDFDPAAFRYRQ